MAGQLARKAPNALRATCFTFSSQNLFISNTCVLTSRLYREATLLVQSPLAHSPTNVQSVNQSIIAACTSQLCSSLPSPSFSSPPPSPPLLPPLLYPSFEALISNILRPLYTPLHHIIPFFDAVKHFFNTNIPSLQLLHIFRRKM